ncbi:MAG: penicillin-binding transpeptidase domain-containing protein [Candidatus Sumerlaeota bacterium]|nr:penicillin-binding transpeptidase domain-containing protein [Candidatus Sumerlaeota bacterium]
MRAAEVERTPMDPHIPPRQETAREIPFFAPRLAVLGAIGAFFLLVLLGRVVYLTILHGEEYYWLSHNNIYRIEPIQAPRGIIYDRFGRALATNQIVYSAYLTPYELTTDTLGLAEARFEQLTGIKPKETHKDLKVKDPKKPYPDPYRRLQLARGLPLNVAARIAERPPDELPGVKVEEEFERVYSTRACPDRYAVGHVIGYTGAIEKDSEIARYLAAGIDVDPQRDRIGKMNLELFYEDELRGTKGSQSQVYDVKMRPRAQPKVIEPAQGGADLTLTLDADLQSTGTRLLDGIKGAIVALDPRTGEILALVSSPPLGYPKDPGREQSEYNYATREAYAPGSTFKIVTASAALKMGIDPEQVFYCEKYWRFGDTTFKCMFAHGDMNMCDAIRASCNTYFFELASRLHWGPLAETAKAYGFGQKTGIDLADLPGHVGEPPSREAAWRLDGDVIMMAIGQGQHVLVTPLQLACAYAAVANPRGALPQPHLVRRIDFNDDAGDRRSRLIQPPDRGPTPAADPYIRRTLIEGFRRAVADPGGTAYKAQFPPEWKAAGKTGSAEGRPGVPTDAWFVAFAPYDDPEICVAVLGAGLGHGGEEAAPIAKKFLETYFRVTRPRLRQALDAEPVEAAQDSDAAP